MLRGFGGGAVAAIAVPIVASFCLALGYAIGLPVGDLRELPTSMIALWGPVFGVMLVAPVAFVLGALAVRRAQRRLTIATPSTTIVRRRSTFVGGGGVLWGAVLAGIGNRGFRVGWVLIPVGLIAGAIGGSLAALGRCLLLTAWDANHTQPNSGCTRRRPRDKPADSTDLERPPRAEPAGVSRSEPMSRRQLCGNLDRERFCRALRTPPLISSVDAQVLRVVLSSSLRRLPYFGLLTPR